MSGTRHTARTALSESTSWKFDLLTADSKDCLICSNLRTAAVSSSTRGWCCGLPIPHADRADNTPEAFDRIRLPQFHVHAAACLKRKWAMRKDTEDEVLAVFDGRCQN